MRYIRWILHLNCYTHGGLCMCRVITKQLMYSSSCNIGFVHTSFQSSWQNRTRGRTESFINYYLIIYYWDNTCSITHLWTSRKCVVHWYTHNPHYSPVYTVFHIDERIGQNHALPPQTGGPVPHQWSAQLHSYASSLVPNPLMLWGPTFSIAEWRCLVRERYCGSSNHRDHTHHRSSTGHSWQLHRNSTVLPVEVFHMWYAAPSNQCSRWTPPHWTGTLASQHCRVHKAFHSAIQPTCTVPSLQQLYCDHCDRWVPSIHPPLWGVTTYIIITSPTEHTILTHKTLRVAVSPSTLTHDTNSTSTCVQILYRARECWMWAWRQLQKICNASIVHL